MPPNGLGAQLRPTALTASATARTLTARTVPRIDWAKLLGVSCSALLGDGEPDSPSMAVERRSQRSAFC